MPKTKHQIFGFENKSLISNYWLLITNYSEKRLVFAEAAPATTPPAAPSGQGWFLSREFWRPSKEVIWDIAWFTKTAVLGVLWKGWVWWWEKRTLDRFIGSRLPDTAIWLLPDSATKALLTQKLEREKKDAADNKSISELRKQLKEQREQDPWVFRRMWRAIKWWFSNIVDVNKEWKTTLFSIAKKTLKWWTSPAWLPPYLAYKWVETVWQIAPWPLNKLLVWKWNINLFWLNIPVPWILNMPIAIQRWFMEILKIPALAERTALSIAQAPFWLIRHIPWLWWSGKLVNDFILENLKITSAWIDRYTKIRYMEPAPKHIITKAADLALHIWNETLDKAIALENAAVSTAQLPWWVIRRTLWKLPFIWKYIAKWAWFVNDTILDQTKITRLPTNRNIATDLLNSKNSIFWSRSAANDEFYGKAKKTA